MKHIRFLIVLMVGLCISAESKAQLSAESKAQHAVFSASSFLSLSKQAAPRTLASTAFASTQVLNFNAAQAEQIFLKTPADKITINDFPLEKNTYKSLELTRARPVVDGETDIMLMTNNGAVKLPTPALINYRGKIVGDDNSVVTLVYANGELYAALQQGDGTQSQVVPSMEANAKGVHLMSVSRDMNAHMPFKCYSDQLPDYFHFTGDEMSYRKGNTVQASVLKEAEIAIQTDRFLFTRLKKTGEAEAVTVARIINYVNAIFAVVSQKYEDEINVTFRISNLTVYTETQKDPYTANASGDISTLLSQMKSYWATNLSSIPRDLAHLLTAPGSGSVGGIAYRQTLCNKGTASQFSSGGYAVSGVQGGFNLPMLTYIWDTFVVTHEIGHNFAARHTHDCWWSPPLDSCVNSSQIDDACWSGTPKANPGSIMSYCHLIIPAPRYTFLPRVATVIRGGADAASCLTEPAQAKVKVIFPLGGNDELFRSDTTLTVKWTSAKVNTVNVEYSLDSGKTWSSIASGVAAATGNAQWKLAVAQNSTKCLVRVYDSGNQVVGDTSYAVFTINLASITMLTPVGGERLGRKTTHQIDWQTTMIPSCHVEFSATGAEPWTRLVSSQSTSSLDWTVPDIETSTARIRVIDATIGNVIAVSGLFAIGTPTMEIKYPVGGEELCANTQYQIQWQSDFIPLLRIELSTDGGTTYPLTQRISNSQEAKAGTMTWTTPANRIGTNLRVRLVNLSSTSMNSASPASFAIKNCGAPSSVSDYDSMEGFEIASLLPNPASSNISVRLKNNANIVRSMECLLIASDGRSIPLGSRIADLGETVLTFSLNDIPQGSYIFALRANGEQLSMPFVIVR